MSSYSQKGSNHCQRCGREGRDQERVATALLEGWLGELNVGGRSKREQGLLRVKGSHQLTVSLL